MVVRELRSGCLTLPLCGYAAGRLPTAMLDSQRERRWAAGRHWQRRPGVPLRSGPPSAPHPERSGGGVRPRPPNAPHPERSGGARHRGSPARSGPKIPVETWANAHLRFAPGETRWVGLSEGCLAVIHGAGIAASASSPTLGVSNKPMVPTAPTSPTANPPRPLRRHIGQSLGRKAAISGGVSVATTVSRV